MAQTFPRVYRSFEEFERAELSRLDHFYGAVTGLVDAMLAAELDDERAVIKEPGPCSDELDEFAFALT